MMQTKHVALSFIALAAWLAWLQFAQWPVFLTGTFAHQDMAVYATGGWLVEQGLTPYLDFWEHKPPLIYLLNAAAITLTGNATWGVWLLSLLALWAGLGTGYWALRGIFSRKSALLGLAFWALLLLPSLEGGNLTEVYAMPLQWAIIGLMLRLERAGLPVVSGVVIGFSGIACFLLRQNLASTAFAAGLVLVALALKKRDKTAIMTLVGIALSLITSLAGFWLLTTPEFRSAMWQQAFVFNFSYTDANSWSRRFRVMRKVVSIMPVTLIALFGWGKFLHARFRYDAARRDDASGCHSVSASALLFIAVLVPIDWLASAMSGRLYAHYFMQISPAFTVAAVLALTQVTALLPVRTCDFGRAVALALAVITFSQNAGAFVPATATDAVRVTRAQNEWLAANATPDQPILIWGGHIGSYLHQEQLPACTLYYLTPAFERHAGAESLVDSVLLPCLDEGALSPGTVIFDHSPFDRRIPPLLPVTDAESRWDNRPEATFKLRDILRSQINLLPRSNPEKMMRVYVVTE